MKRILFFTLTFAMLFTFAACGGEKTYTLKDVALYDAQTNRYIEIGYSRKTVTDMLGEPTSETAAIAIYPSKEVTYDKYGLTLTFDEKDCVEYIKLSSTDKVTDTKRLTIGKKLSAVSGVNDFMKLFPDAVSTDGVAHCERKKIAFDAESNNDNLRLIDANTDSRYNHIYSAYIDYNDSGTRWIVVGEYGQSH